VSAVRIPGGIRPIDVAATVIVIAAVELNIGTATGADQRPLNAVAYLAGAILPLPVLLRRRWPLWELLGCSVLMFFYYIFDRRNISPAPLLCLPLYDATVAGYLVLAVVIPAVFMAIGFIVVDVSEHQGVTAVAAEFLESTAVLFLAVMLGEVVRSRRALAAETAGRLRLADEEREAEAARRVAEERLRIARDLHDTVAHSMATITVQAGSALHVLDSGHSGGRVAAPDGLRDSLAAIRETSENALTDIRATLGRLRRDDTDGGNDAGGGGNDAGEGGSASLDRLAALAGAVTAAGAPVRLTIEGERVALPARVDHAAYRILQESLTNVLRHGGPEATATVRLSFGADALTIQVTDDGGGGPGTGDAADADAGDAAMAGTGSAAARGADGDAGDAGMAGTGSAAAAGAHGGGGPAGSGHGITGMTERAAALGGELTAGPRPEGGFEILARLPTSPGDAVVPGGPGATA